jgi:hypothetical protein
MDKTQVDMILKALKDGWSVKMTKENEIIFSKPFEGMTEKEKSEIQQSNYSVKFLESMIKN